MAVRRGARVRVVDPRGPGGGASGGVLGALAPHAPERWTETKALQRDALLSAGDWWAGIEAASGMLTGYGRTGRLQPLATEADVARARNRADLAASHWGDGATWRIVEADEAGPFRPVSATGLWVHDTLSARLDPGRAMVALARAVTAAGGGIVAEGPEQGPERGPVIDATGWEGLVRLSDEVGRPLGRGARGQAARLAFDAGGAPQVFAGGFHIVPHDDGTVAVGSTTERDGAGETETDARLDEVIEAVRAAMPMLADAPVVARWAGTRPRTATRTPVVGQWPGREHRVILNGGFKIGLALAPPLAEMAVDLALDGRDRVPDAFRIETLLSA